MFIYILYTYNIWIWQRAATFFLWRRYANGKQLCVNVSTRLIKLFKTGDLFKTSDRTSIFSMQSK